MHESKVLINFIDDLSNSQYIIADKGYYSEALPDKNAEPVIPSIKNSKTRNADIYWLIKMKDQ